MSLELLEKTELEFDVKELIENADNLTLDMDIYSVIVEEQLVNA